jgi:hypothetical protein
MTAIKVERRGKYQGVPQYSITGAAEITPSRATARKWAEQSEAESAAYARRWNARAQAAYEADCAARPVYPDGGRRKSWAELSDAVRDTWRRNPTPRWNVPAGD